MSRKKHRNQDDGREQARARFDEGRGRFKDQVVVTAKTAGQRDYIIAVKNNDITFCFGPAGSGKTAIAVGIALQGIMAPQSPYEKLVIMRPAKEACDEHIGFLPGNLEEKMGPWAAPIMDNMSVFIGKTAIRNLFWEGKVEVVPLAFARGRSLNKSFIILDEAQNCTPKQLLMVLTRIGEGSKLVINGDVDQSDNPNDQCGMSDAADRLDGMDNVAIVEMGPTDIVRNPMIAEILRRYSEGQQGR